MMREPPYSLLKAPAPMALRGKRVLVLGLGDTGLSVARWVQRHGGIVRAADTRREPPRKKDYAGELVTGNFKVSLLKGIDLVCISPGLSLEEDVIQSAITRNIPIAGDIELFAWHVRRNTKSKVLAVTGTNGKSTVTALTTWLLTEAGIPAVGGGNIGPPALEALSGRNVNPDVWVLELSSYQLETTWSLAPHAATMLNLSEDHLDRYAGLAQYAAAKARVFQGTGVQVLNRCDSASMALAAAGRTHVTFGIDAPALAEDFGVRDGSLVRGDERILAVKDLGISGAHNVSNALAACALATQAGAPLAALAKGLRTFHGLPHRMQNVGERGGVVWLDDSKGTNVGATVAALNGLSRPAILILGGDGKGQDFSPLAPVVGRKAKQVLLIGKDAAVIRRALKGVGIPIEKARTLEEAVKRAARIARPGDAVLLSPACASFDMFRDYRQRGEAFAAAVKALRG